MKLEVGMYVRTKCGKIYQLTELDLQFEMTKQTTAKASHNIIDLIEVGDYVNGYKVLIKSSECERPILVYGINTNDKQIAITIYEEDIKSIVTKEHFKANEYVIEK